MSTVIKAIPRGKEVTALRVLLGTTTRGEIKAFCPSANVGYVAHKGVDIDAETDIRWVVVPHNGSLTDELSNDGDWIVQRSPGHFFILTDTEFHREYVMA